MLAWDAGKPGATVTEPVERIAPRRPHGHHSPPTTKQRQAWLLWAALATGAGFRVLYYLSGRSLWIDEARLALNVAGRGYAGLLRPLDYDQAASPLFLWGEKFVTQLLG